MAGVMVGAMAGVMVGAMAGVMVATSGDIGPRRQL